MDTSPRQDQLFYCLAHRHRRAIVDVLRRAPSPIATAELAQNVASEIDDSSTAESTLESIRASLYHSHLPRLEEADLVDYDAETGVVAPTEYTSLSAILVDTAELVARTADREASDVAGEQNDRQVPG